MTVLTPALSLPEKLKSGTGLLHARLESHPHLQELMSPSLNRGHYARVLALFYGYFAPLEGRLNQLLKLEELLPDYPQRRKSSALLHDYQVLTGLHETAELPLCSDLPQINNLSEAFGCLYVMEGSTLGGRFIARHVSQTLGEETLPALTFFNGYGELTGQYWKTFRETLTRYAGTELEEDRVLESANVTFQLFYDWMNTRHG